MLRLFEHAGAERAVRVTPKSPPHVRTFGSAGAADANSPPSPGSDLQDVELGITQQVCFLVLFGVLLLLSTTSPARACRLQLSR